MTNGVVSPFVALPVNNPVRSRCPMHVGRAQKFFTYAGYYSNEFARKSVRCVERLARPMPQGKGYWLEVAERVKQTMLAMLFIPKAALLSVPAMAFYAVASCLGPGRFEFLEAESAANFWQERSIKVLTLNTCFQDPWSPLSGGVESPMKPVGNCASRVAAVVHAIAKENPTLFLGQEFDNIGAQDETIRLMKENGFRFFLRDLGSNDCVRNSSGLFVASKVPLSNIEFVPYPSEDRAGLAKWSNQGALTFTVCLNGKDLRFVNVHLNYGEGKENQEARNRQLKRHVVPLLKRGNGVIMGDFNFNTASVNRTASGLFGLKNALAGKVTCTDAGKHSLRGKSLTLGGKPCTDCAERIDALVYDPTQIAVLDSQLKPFRLNGELLSDHFASIATLAIV